MITADFAFAADLHLRPHAWANRPAVRDDAYHSFLQIVDWCVRYRAALVLGGDIFDQRRPDARSLQVFSSGAARLAEAGLRIFFVQGNHDHSDPPWPALFPCTTALADSHPLKVGSYRVGGLDWQPAGRLREALAGVGACNFVVTHQSWHEIQQAGIAEGRISEIAWPCEYLLTGDYHGMRMLAVDAGGRRLFVGSPGSTCMQAINEAPTKFFFSVCRTDHGPAVTPIRLRTRRVANFRIESEAAADSLLQVRLPRFLQLADRYRMLTDLPETLWMPLVRISYPAELPDFHRRVSDLFGQHVHLFLNPMARTEVVDVDFDGLGPSAFSSLIAAARTLGGDAPHVEPLCRLLAARDIPAEYAAISEEFMGPVR